MNRVINPGGPNGSTISYKEMIPSHVSNGYCMVCGVQTVFLAGGRRWANRDRGSYRMHAPRYRLQTFMCCLFLARSFCCQFWTAARLLLKLQTDLCCQHVRCHRRDKMIRKNGALDIGQYVTVITTYALRA